MIKLVALLLASACLLACTRPANQQAAAPGVRVQSAASYCVDNPQACLNK